MDEIEITIPPTPPQPDPEAIRANARLDELLTQIQTANEENRQWTETQINQTLSRLENLEATAVTGMENLSRSLAETKDLLIQKLAELQAERNQPTPPQVDNPEQLQTPPEEAPPPSPPENAEDLPAPANQQQNQNPRRPKPNRRVI